MIHDVASFVRWRLKPNRWAVKGMNALAEVPYRLRTEATPVVSSELGKDMLLDGYVKLGRQLDLPEIDLTTYRGRAAGKPFVDIKHEHMAAVTKTMIDLLGEPDTANLVNEYFAGRPWLWNFSLNYSDPMQGITDSQQWHFDYGDTRQLHFMVYFSDVGLDCGPFTFLPAAASDKVTRHPLVIERMTDEDLVRDAGIDASREAIRLCGKRGDVFANDPGRLMHQGARCDRPRLVLFVTFTSRAPMSRGGMVTISADERAALGEALRRERPDCPIPAGAFA